MRNFCFPDPGRDAMHPFRYDAHAHGCNATSKHLLAQLSIPNRRTPSRPSFILCLPFGFFSDSRGSFKEAKANLSKVLQRNKLHRWLETTTIVPS
jgi:hypothetical protein